MQKPISLSIFFPAYNEEANIARAVRKAHEVARESPFIREYEIIIINDGSNDQTGAIAEELEKRSSKVRVIHHSENQGYGAALVTGLHAATKEYVFFTDADLQFDILELQNLLIHVSEYPVVIGYRAPRKDPWMRLANAKVWNLLNRFFFGLKVRDIDCAFKVFRRDLVEDLPLKSHGAMISAETLIRLNQMGVAIKEIPVTHLPRLYGSPTGAKLSVIISALREMFTLYRGELGSITQKEFAKFIMVGLINTAIDLCLYILLTRFVPMFSEAPVTAKFVSFMAGTVSSFVLNRQWTFAIETRLTWAEIARFYTAVSAALIVNVGLMYFFVNVIHLYDLVALIGSTAGSFLTNYLLAKAWVFRKEEEIGRPLPVIP